MQECACVEEAIRRARSLLAAEPIVPESLPLGDVDSAAQSTAGTTQIASGSSGALITQHSLLASRSAATLSAAAQTDWALQEHMTTAAAITRAGARRLGCVQQSGVRVGPDQRYRRVVAE